MGSRKYRKIIHIDMDAYFASVEQMDYPEYRDKPLAVGGAGRGGVVAAASYEARKFGVHSAMPSVIAAKRCPNLIFVSPRFERYKKLSSQIRKIFHRFTDLVEPLSLDEAYLDVSYNKKKLTSAIRIAQLIRKQIKEEVGLTASAGVSFNKFLAKTASDIDKPDGLTAILPEQAEAFLKKMPIEKFHGVGKKTAEKMARLGIKNGQDLLAVNRSDLLKHFGKAGIHFYRMVRADDDRKVVVNRIRKSIGAERTYPNLLSRVPEMIENLENIHLVLMSRIQQSRQKGKTITLKLKYANYEVRSRSKTLDHFTNNSALIWNVASKLLEEVMVEEKAIRLLGITLSQFEQKAEDSSAQLTLTF